MKEIYIRDTIEDIIYYVVAVGEISISKNVTITQYPTTEGAKISDHAYNQPKAPSINFAISEYNKDNGFYCINKFNNKVRLSFEQTKELVNKWVKEHTVLELQTLNDKFDNLLISSLRFNEADSLGVIKFAITFQEIRFAKLKTITVPVKNVASKEDYANENGEQSVGNTSANLIGTVAGQTTTGVLLGAAIGSIFPGAGTVIGAAIGGVVGIISGFINWGKK